MEHTKKPVYYCQSCGKYLDAVRDSFGTNEDGTINTDYCRDCFDYGRFVEPYMTRDRMIDRVTNLMIKMGRPEFEIYNIPRTIAQLKRWTGYTDSEA